MKFTKSTVALELPSVEDRMENVKASSTPTDSREYINVGCCNELSAADVADGYARIRGLGAHIEVVTEGMPLHLFR
jgi:hypothetical protein